MASGVTHTDRVVLALPTEWAVGWDCLAATPELGGVTTLMHRPDLTDVLEFGPSVLITTPTEALRLARCAAGRQVDLSETGISRCGGDRGARRQHWQHAAFD